jgi:energy-coupling factor transporter transmembrane protein EcfT
MKFNKYNLTAFGIIGVLSSYLISKSGLQFYFSIPLALVLGFVILAIANRLAARASNETGQDDSDTSS